MTDVGEADSMGEVKQTVVAVVRDRVVPYVIAAVCVFAVLVLGWGATTGGWAPTWDVWVPLGLFSAWIGVEVVERRRSDRERLAATRSG